MDEKDELRVQRLVFVDSEGQEVARLWAERGRGGAESFSIDVGGFYLDVIVTGMATRICARDTRVSASHALFEVGIDASGIGFVVDNRASVSFALSGDPAFNLAVFASQFDEGPGWKVRLDQEGALSFVKVDKSGAHRVVFDSADS